MALEKARGIERFTGSSLPSTYLAECIALVAEGDAVDPDAAAEHLPDCASIVVKILNGHAVGVGAIKGRRPQYAKLVATRSGHSFDDQMRELGYVAVGQNHQRQGISKEIVKALLDTAGQQPLFATTSSEHMARTLSSHGFALRGDKWPSKKGEDLRLWIRDV